MEAFEVEVFVPGEYNQVQGVSGIGFPYFQQFKLGIVLYEGFIVSDAFMVSNGLFGIGTFIFGGEILG
jgi:hypothetical protein